MWGVYCALKSLKSFVKEHVGRFLVLMSLRGGAGSPLRNGVNLYPTRQPACVSIRQHPFSKNDLALGLMLAERRGLRIGFRLYREHFAYSPASYHVNSLAV